MGHSVLRSKHTPTAVIALVLLECAGLSAQTTQGLISGTIRDQSNGNAIAGTVMYCRVAANGSADRTGFARADRNGFYVLPLLSPGEYRVRAQAESAAPRVQESDCFPPPAGSPTFQAQEKHELILGVGARLTVNFDLRPSGGVRDSNETITPDDMVIRFFGADQRTMKSITVDTGPASRQSGGSTVSYDVDPRALESLPLPGRDVYALLTLMPGVTADTSTGRGLGLSVNGQRPSSSNYMLDGVENNNDLITGPLSPVAPEAVQEYRISTNNFSAEYGRTSGFLANAVTRSPGSAWHGLAYFYTKNQALNANEFQQNLKGVARTPLKEIQPGFSVGGSLIPQRLFLGVSFEYLRYRSKLTPQTYDLPTASFATADSLAGQILKKYPAPNFGGGSLPIVTVQMAPTSSLNRYFGTPRLDYVSANGAHRLTARLAVASYDQPDAVWSPYRGFSTPLSQRSTGLAVHATSVLRPGLINEARAGWSLIDVRYDQQHPEFPSLDAGSLSLPGSASFYSLHNHASVTQAADNLLWSTSGHQIKLGGGVFLRHLENYLKIAENGYIKFDNTFDTTGQLQFTGVQNFAADRPTYLVAPVSRNELFASTDGHLNLQIPKSDRAYRLTDFFLFAQDSFKVTSRFTLDYGVRYDYFGTPLNTGAAKDGLVQLGSGTSLPERIVSSSIVFPSGGDQQLYSASKSNWAGRTGFAYGLNGNSTMSLRGGFGVFYDRPFDNLWQNIGNNSVVLTLQKEIAPDYLASVSTQLQRLSTSTIASIDNLRFIHPTLYQPDWKSAYTASYFLGLQMQVSSRVILEMNGLGSRGRRLVTSDWVNRAQSFPFGTQPQNLKGYLNPALPEMSYRSNQGNSDYTALTTTLRYRGARGQLQASYSWSHNIDTQSDPLTGEFDFTQLRQGGSGLNGIAGFSRQFDSNADRGNSDFDQRHNLVVFSTWDLPSVLASTRASALFRDWRVSEVAALRSGRPYSVLAPSGFSFTGQSIVNNRADILDSRLIKTDQAVEGGRQLLSLAGFGVPAGGTVGNTGRNVFSGPGLYSIDLSLSRSIAIPQLHEGARLVLRADAYNFLNHANLGNPSADLSYPEQFGVAQYGRTEKNSGFPLLGPLRETARQIQILIRMEF